eukprot:1249239-Pyramimonas_sp.AAC.1
MADSSMDMIAIQIVSDQLASIDVAMEEITSVGGEDRHRGADREPLTRYQQQETGRTSKRGSTRHTIYT